MGGLIGIGPEAGCCFGPDCHETRWQISSELCFNPGLKMKPQKDFCWKAFQTSRCLYIRWDFSPPVPFPSTLPRARRFRAVGQWCENAKTRSLEQRSTTTKSGCPCWEPEVFATVRAHIRVTHGCRLASSLLLPLLRPLCCVGPSINLQHHTDGPSGCKSALSRGRKTQQPTYGDHFGTTQIERTQHPSGEAAVQAGRESGWRMLCGALAFRSSKRAELNRKHIRRIWLPGLVRKMRSSSMLFSGEFRVEEAVQRMVCLMLRLRWETVQAGGCSPWAG